MIIIVTETKIISKIFKVALSPQNCEILEFFLVSGNYK